MVIHKENILCRAYTTVTHIIIWKLQQVLIFKCNFLIHEGRLEIYFHKFINCLQKFELEVLCYPPYTIPIRTCVTTTCLGHGRNISQTVAPNQMLKQKQQGHNSKERTNSSSKKASIKLSNVQIYGKVTSVWVTILNP